MKWLGCVFALLVVNSLSSTACAQDAATTEPACGALGPSSDKVAIAHIAAMIERPENVAQLLQNLKLAHEKALLLDPAFYDDDNLTKFFGGTKVTWSSPKRNIGPASTARDIEIAADTSIFPQLVIKLTRSCEPISNRSLPTTS